MRILKDTLPNQYATQILKYTLPNQYATQRQIHHIMTILLGVLLRSLCNSNTPIVADLGFSVGKWGLIFGGQQETPAPGSISAHTFKTGKPEGIGSCSGERACARGASTCIHQQWRLQRVHPPPLNLCEFCKMTEKL